MVIMRNTTVLNVKIDKELKEQAQEVARAVGLPISTVVAANLKEFVRTRTITFSDTPKLKPNVEKELLELSKDAKKGKNISPGFDNLSESFDWLDS
jgi:addiction module RelB/DinJ family antitoxin